MTFLRNIWRFFRRHFGIDANEPRVSIWSIPESRRTLYFGLFAILTLVGVGWVCWYEIFYRTEDDWPQTINSILYGIPIAGAASAVTTISTIETWRFIVVVGDWLAMKIQESRRRREEETEARIAQAEAQREQAEAQRERAETERERAETERERAETRMKIVQEWNRRREAAMAAGEQFTEPFPLFPDADSP